jgi:ectoine hydroxylase-related dioxygenase (phytanoyl-CoA dioxygenase family)
VGAWVPLDDAVVENGCLWFLPGSHLGEVLPHRHVGDDPSIHILELVEPVDTSDAVAVPTKAGGATFHHRRMLHHSEPNTTDADRRAYANEFQTPPRPRATPADRPWVLDGRKAYDERDGTRA